MPNVVVTGGLIQCSHMGVVKLSGGDVRIAVSGAGAITFGMEANLSFAPGAPGLVTPCACPNKAPPPAFVYCTATLPATTGVSTLLAIDGKGVLLANASGRAINAADPAATWSVAAPGQILLTATA